MLLAWVIVLFVAMSLWSYLKAHQLTLLELIDLKERAVSAHHSRISSQCPHAGRTGDRFRVQIEARNAKGQRLKKGGKLFSIIVTRRSSKTMVASFAATDKKNGLYEADIEVPRSGMYDVMVMFNKHNVTGSPFAIEVRPEEYNIILSKNEIIAGQEVMFRVEPERMKEIKASGRLTRLDDVADCLIDNLLCTLKRDGPLVQIANKVVTRAGECTIKVRGDLGVPIGQATVIVLPDKPSINESTFVLTSNHKLVKMDNNVNVARIPQPIQIRNILSKSSSNAPLKTVISIELRFLDQYQNTSIPDKAAVVCQVLDETNKPLPSTLEPTSKGYVTRASIENGSYTVRVGMKGKAESEMEYFERSPIAVTALLEEDYQLYKRYDVSGRANFKGVLLSGKGPLGPIPTSNHAQVIIAKRSVVIETSRLLIFSKTLHRFIVGIADFKATRLDANTIELSDCRFTFRMQVEKPLLLMFTLQSIGKNFTFARKIEWFKKQLRKNPSHSNETKIKINRSNFLSDSISKIKSISPTDLRDRRLKIQFNNERGVDAGGLKKEWFDKLATEMASGAIKGYHLFHSPGDNNLYQPSPFSDEIPDYTTVFRMLGRIVGKSIYETVLYNPLHMNIHFTSSFYKQLLSIPISFQDMENVDPEIYRNRIKLIQDNDISMVKEILAEDEITFSETIVIGANKKTFHLKHFGNHKSVNEQNKMEYLHLLVECHLKDSIENQVSEFKKGLNEIISEEDLSIFDWNELELLICGVPDVDVSELEHHIQFSSNERIKAWLIDALKSFTGEQRVKFIQFVTGSSSLPVGGIKNLNPQLNVELISNDDDQLPSAHTCFNTLDLPIYSSAEVLKEKLLLAITEGFEGFDNV